MNEQPISLAQGPRNQGRVGPVASIVPLRPATTLLYDEACRAVATAHRVDEAKDIRDKMVALETYAKQANNGEMERQAREIRIRAERKCGELLKQMPKHHGGHPVVAATVSSQTRPTPKQLRDIGVTHDQSSRWQKLAAVPEPDFEAAVADRAWAPSTDGIIERHEIAQMPRTPQVTKVSGDALWLWGWLDAFERTGALERDPKEMLPTMLGHMKETTLRLAPLVAAWLGKLR